MADKIYRCPFDRDQLYNIGPLPEHGDDKDNWACPTCYRLWVGCGGNEWFSRLRIITKDDFFKLLNPNINN